MEKSLLGTNAHKKEKEEEEGRGLHRLPCVRDPTIAAEWRSSSSDRGRSRLPACPREASYRRIS